MLDAEETGGDCDRSFGGDEEVTLDTPIHKSKYQKTVKP